MNPSSYKDNLATSILPIPTEKAEIVQGRGTPPTALHTARHRLGDHQAYVKSCNGDGSQSVESSRAATNPSPLCQSDTLNACSLGGVWYK